MAIHADWQNHRDNVYSPFVAIETSNSYQHIGNIKLGPIDWARVHADIILFINEKIDCGKGYALPNLYSCFQTGHSMI